MATKLTLSMDKDTIEKGKRISKQQNKSLSAFLKDLINAHPDKEQPTKMSVRELSAYVQKNTKPISNGVDYRAVVREDRRERIAKQIKK